MMVVNLLSPFLADCVVTAACALYYYCDTVSRVQLHNRREDIAQAGV